jgi:ATP-dependent Lon protease
MKTTGKLGDVMKESIDAASSYVRSISPTLGVKPTSFDKLDIHVHVPEGATPKDGPSAGVTMLTSLVSLFTQRKVKKSLAMTGEITLRGKVLPVGGIKEKILAAKRARIKEILLCEDNRRDIDEIKPEYLKGLTFHYVTDMSDVLKLALTNQKVKNAKKL